jgi:hypothetical protein
MWVWNRKRWVIERFLPPHPGLSLGERENRMPHSLMSNVKHTVSLAAVVLTSMFLAVSCVRPQPKDHVYGEVGPNKIRVVINGSNARNPGIYYFTNGTSLQTALVASDNLENNQFGRRLRYENWCGDHYQQTLFKNYKRMSTPEREAVTLHDSDLIYFPHGGPW